MLFNTFQFLIFYAAVCLAYFSTPTRWRWVPLLAASYAFYMSWKPEYGVLLLASTLVDYWVGIKLAEAKIPWRRKLLVGASISANLGMLIGFKYADFFGGSLAWVGDFVGWNIDSTTLGLLLPVGISFYTFQSMSYTFDVYRGVKSPERHFGYFAIYVSFFPQLIAGPIERANLLIPQLRASKLADFEGIRSGLQRMLWGAFKKIVIADNAAVVVSTVYAQPADYAGAFVLFATVLFALQIYCDFSAYSDIAIGSARVMGVHLSENFRRPFFASSLRNYWRRRHITLVSWFRDYVYIPMGGSRGSRWRTQLNIMVVFLLSGLWHGAAWTFVLWGALHALCLIAETWLSRFREPLLTRLGRWSYYVWYGLRHVWVIGAVLAGYVLFRSPNFADAALVFEQLARWAQAEPSVLWELGLGRVGMLILLATIAVLLSIDWIEETQTPWAYSLWSRRPFRWFVYVTGLYAIVFFGNLGRVEFIYFQF
jgi:D-alanyl-lipoteichoic acid acyltransferase DltB (MBOAT superfamily)